MKKTNSQLTTLHIATQPSQALDRDRDYKKVCDATSCQLNVSYKKQDSNYFCNNGETTSTITGRTISLSVSIDYDTSNDAHKYLKSLLVLDFASCNNQYIKLELLLDDSMTKTTLTGKACIQFKTMPPSGGPDELGKIEFDIFPQDKAFEWGTE